jgi:hypothetical protein
MVLEAATIVSTIYESGRAPAVAPARRTTDDGRRTTDHGPYFASFQFSPTPTSTVSGTFN